MIGFGKLGVIHVVELSFPFDAFPSGHAQLVYIICNTKPVTLTNRKTRELSTVRKYSILFSTVVAAGNH